MRINLLKVLDLYGENYKTTLKDIENLNKWKYIPCSQTGRLKILKISILPQSDSIIPINSQRIFHVT